MTELTCNVAKDLLPSYVDGICSEDSRHLIGQHLAACPECLALEKMLRESETRERQDETRQIAYLKKLKKHSSRKDLFALCMLFVITGVSVRIFMDTDGVLSYFYMIVLPLLLCNTQFLLSDHITRNEKTKPKTILTVLGSLLVCYGAFLALWLARFTLQDRYPFGLEPQQVGPFFGYQCIFLAVCGLAVLAAAIALSLKTSNSHSTIISISMTGIFLPIYIYSSLRTIASVELVTKFRGYSVYLLLEGACIAGIVYVLEKKRLRKALK